MVYVVETHHEDCDAAVETIGVRKAFAIDRKRRRRGARRYHEVVFRCVGRIVPSMDERIYDGSSSVQAEVLGKVGLTVGEDQTQLSFRTTRPSGLSDAT